MNYLLRLLTQIILFVMSTTLIAQEELIPAGDKGFNIEGHSFIALQVVDDEAAARWYRNTFGLQEVNHLEAPNGKASVRILSGSGLSVELIDHSAAEPGPTGYQHGLFKAGIYVDDINAALAWMTDLGVDPGIGIFTDQALKARSFVFRDPWGNRLQIFEQCKDECQ